MAIDLHDLFDRLQLLPANLGYRAFDAFAKIYVPHSALMGFRLEHLTSRSIAVSMPDRPTHRNHLKSLHAMALAHLGEYTGGVLLLYSVAPLGYRTILRSYTIEYLAKARGRVTGRASLKLPKKFSEKKDFTMEVDIEDATGKLVAKAKSGWRIGKIPGAPRS